MSLLAELYGKGKVRDIYEAGEHLVMVASDRISAFDVVLPWLDWITSPLKHRLQMIVTPLPT